MTPPSRIGFDAQLLAATGEGVARAISKVIEYLARVAPQYEYVVYNTRGGLAPELFQNPRVTIKRSRLPMAIRLARIFWQQTVLPLQLKRDDIALLHSPAYTAPIMTNVPAVLSIYDTAAFSLPELCKKATVLHYRMFMRASAQRATRIIAPSEATKKDIIRLLGIPHDKIRVIPLGVGDQFRPRTVNEIAAALAELHLPSRYVLYVGNFEPKKNLARLMEAFLAARRDAGFPHRLVLAGRKRWGTSQIFQTARAQNAGNEIIFAGHVPEHLLPALYSGASLFIFPSLHEGFGLPPLEAMACGAPVATSNTGAVPEVVGDAAILTPPENVAELKQVIERVLLDSALARKLGDSGTRRAALFSWEETARRTAVVYAEVLNERHVENKPITK